MIEPLDAIYEKGVLRLKRKISIADGTEVQVIVISPGGRFDATSATAALERIAQQPMERDDAGFSGENHDEVLYSGGGR